MKDQIVQHGCKHEYYPATVEVHKYGRQALCKKCGRMLVAANIVKVKPRQRPKMTKKERRKVRHGNKNS